MRERRVSFSFLLFHTRCRKKKGSPPSPFSSPNDLRSSSCLVPFLHEQLSKKRERARLAAPVSPLPLFLSEAPLEPRMQLVSFFSLSTSMRMRIERRELISFFPFSSAGSRDRRVGGVRPLCCFPPFFYPQWSKRMVKRERGCPHFFLLSVDFSPSCVRRRRERGAPL